MAIKKVVDVAKKVVKITVGGATCVAAAQAIYLGAQMTFNDVEMIGKIIDSKRNPIIMKKRHWYSKPEAFNTRKNQFVSDMK